MKIDSTQIKTPRKTVLDNSGVFVMAAKTAFNADNLGRISLFSF